MLNYRTNLNIPFELVKIKYLSNSDFGSGALIGKLLLERIIQNNKDAYFRSDYVM